MFMLVSGYALRTNPTYPGSSLTPARTTPRDQRHTA